MEVTSRREFMKWTVGAIAALSGAEGGASAGDAFPGNRQLGCIQNNDINNILYNSSGADITPDEYREAVGHLLDGKPNVLAQNVGLPDPVIYRSNVATPWDKYLVEVSLETWPKEDPARIREGAARQADAVAKLMRLGYRTRSRSRARCAGSGAC